MPMLPPNGWGDRPLYVVVIDLGRDGQRLDFTSEPPVIGDKRDWWEERIEEVFGGVVVDVGLVQWQRD